MGVRIKGVDSATFRIQVLITNGQFLEAEALLAHSLAAGLLSQVAAAQLQERLRHSKERQNQEPNRLPPPTLAEEPETEALQRRTCWTEMPDHPVCRTLPEEYSFHSPQQALEAMKKQQGAKNLVLHRPDVAKSGPCPELGEHYNVRMNGERAGSIVCCPCCVENADSPVLWKKCRIVW